MLEEVLKDKINHSFLQDFPTKFASKMCSPLLLPPLKFENLVPSAPAFCGPPPLLFNIQVLPHPKFSTYE